ncbi:hypothetical protein CRT60_01075 [Azospirillum palustre]|uniref:Uncharacterized protein n=1 Tax=Azospirillum palustre TaxID=2044885 RepID=A0A2B8BD29_9PROT|nr:hypothetical protein [Azospirillum palustre]PGH59254.1 hypothetical protein CRT60_01075 [Azospirillum palustre]
MPVNKKRAKTLLGMAVKRTVAMDRVTATVKAAFGNGDIDPRLSEAIARYIWGDEWRDELSNLFADGSTAVDVAAPVGGPCLGALVMRLFSDPRLPGLRRSGSGDADPDCILDEIRQQLRFESALGFEDHEADDITTTIITRASSSGSSLSDSRLRLVGRLLCNADVDDDEITRIAAAATDTSDEAIDEACLIRGPHPDWNRVASIVDAVTLFSDLEARRGVDAGYITRRNERVRAMMAAQPTQLALI